MRRPHREHRPVIVTNTSAQVLSRVSIDRAARLLVTGVAFNGDYSPLIGIVRSPSLTVTIHEIITIGSAAYRPWVGKTANSYASNHAILARDGHRCGYCNRRATTVDHVLPASRGGKNTFGNLIAACIRCNQAKKDRTPQEAGMELLWAPYVHDPWANDQHRVHQLFALAAEVGGLNDYEEYQP